MYSVARSGQKTSITIDARAGAALVEEVVVADRLMDGQRSSIGIGCLWDEILDAVRRLIELVVDIFARPFHGVGTLTGFLTQHLVNADLVVHEGIGATR